MMVYRAETGGYRINDGETMVGSSLMMATNQYKSYESVVIGVRIKSAL